MTFFILELYCLDCVFHLGFFEVFRKKKGYFFAIQQLFRINKVFMLTLKYFSSDHEEPKEEPQRKTKRNPGRNSVSTKSLTVSKTLNPSEKSRP